MTSHASWLLSGEGPFANFFDKFSERQSQRDMAAAVETAMADRSNVLVEAGTGTGKTFAYLVPAVELDGKTVVSTGTKNLQDQLFYKDLPLVFKALGKTRKVALLKGRQNYLCLYRMDQSLATARFTSQQTSAEIIQIKDWSSKTTDGDLSKANFLPEDSMAIGHVVSSADNCLGSDCPDYGDCFVAKARKQAIESDIIVVNHHLLMADLVLKDDGFGELLPHADAYVVDEAHQLPDVASLFFGENITTRQLNEFCRDCEVCYQTEALDCKELDAYAKTVEKAAADFRITLGGEAPRRFWKEYYVKDPIREAFEELAVCLSQLSELLEGLAVRSRDLESLHQRAMSLSQRAEQFMNADNQEVVQWLEVYRKSFSLNSTPLNIAPSFQKAIELYHRSAWVLTSATLAIDNDFTYFQEKLGWTDASREVFLSPFDYREQALIYAPRYIGNPSHTEYTRQFVEGVLPLIKASRGRAFLLFTSHRALQEAADLLATETDFNWFVQGSAGKSFLLEKFRISPNSVLLGTFSFWEGVDVAGDALSFVAIDKLPFASPGDPVNLARINALKQQGKDAFRTLQLPEAVIALKQGAGRLIRDVTDRGVLMIADPRLVGRDYGQLFLSDLPPMLPTRNRDLVTEFLENL